MESNLNTRNCDQCEAVHINGVLCHELGCPDSWRDAMTDCNWCGTEFKPETHGQEFCSDSCACSYHGIPDPDDMGAEYIDPFYIEAETDSEILNSGLADIARGLAVDIARGLTA